MFLYLVFMLFVLISCNEDNELFESKKEIQIIRFKVQVDSSNPMQSDQTSRIEDDWGVLILPANYIGIGKPIKLLIYCHGGGGTVTRQTSQIENIDICKYFVSLGFAVMDMSGMPETYSSRLKIDHSRVLGNFVAIRSYILGYKWVIDNFNIDKKGCLLGGGSNGGLTATNLALHTKIPFLAQIGLSPLMNIKDNAWNISSGAVSGGEFSELQNRANIIRLYGMKDVKNIHELRSAKYEKNKLGEYDPVAYLKENPKLKYPIPYKIWNPVDDYAVWINCTEEFVNIANSRENKVILQKMRSGSHSPESVGMKMGVFIFMNNKYAFNETMYDVGLFLLKYK